LPAIVVDRMSPLFFEEHIGASAGSTMTRANLVVLWHMHQPQYRDPESGRYVLPWTRLHAIKDYWGMIKVLQEVPQFHATFNVVPSLGAQLEEYASGKFDEPGTRWLSKRLKTSHVKIRLRFWHERFN
jgi:alpha-amylase/alpha-mannosidase (GH57 family)